MSTEKDKSQEVRDRRERQRTGFHIEIQYYYLRGERIRPPSKTMTLGFLWPPFIYGWNTVCTRSVVPIFRLSSLFSYFKKLSRTQYCFFNVYDKERVWTSGGVTGEPPWLSIRLWIYHLTSTGLFVKWFFLHSLSQCLVCPPVLLQTLYRSVDSFFPVTGYNSL